MMTNPKMIEKIHDIVLENRRVKMWDCWDYRHLNWTSLQHVTEKFEYEKAIRKMGAVFVHNW